MSGSSSVDRAGTGAASNALRAAAAWRSPLGILVAGFFLFESLSGIFVWLAPFSLDAQMALLVHTIAGLPFLVGYVVYQLRHWLSVRAFPFTHHKVTGYSALGVMLVCLVSGGWLTAEGLFARRISYSADLLHLASGLAVFALVVLHVGTVYVRDGRRSEASDAVPLRVARRRYVFGSTAVAVLLIVVTVAWRLAYPAPDFSWDFPADYGRSYGTERPFAPSLATTAGGGALHPRTLSGSKSCGASGCHEQIYAEWIPSAHRYASIDVGFQAVQKVMAENEGPDSTRYCAGCHDPIALFSGSKNLYSDDLSSPGAEEGVSCIACHRLVETDLKGNASYVVAPPDFYAYELADSGLAGVLGRFLIRTYPRHHAQQYSPPLIRSPEYCGACHKQFIDEEINDFGWVQLQNQYDNWRKSHWNREGEPDERKFCRECHERKGITAPAGTKGRCRAITVECRECHMRLTASRDPAAGDDLDLYRDLADGRHRNHRFIGANQFMPGLLALPGHEEQTRLTEEWLAGHTVLPELGHKWPAVTAEYLNSEDRRPAPDARPSGPILPIRIRVASESVRAGETVTYGVEIASRKVGHDFPTGPLDIIQCWVETEVRDASGTIVYQSGKLNEEHFVPEGSFMFKAEGVDAQGNLIDRHNLWELVGARFKRALFPGFTDTAEFRFVCPSQAPKENRIRNEGEHEVVAAAPGKLEIRARLLYRKVNQHLLNMITGRKDLTARVSVVDEQRIEVEVRPGS